MEDNITQELELLLNNFWITKEDKDNYYLLKRNQNKIKNFTSKNLGSKLIIHDKFIKLEKIPAIPKHTLGIEDFTSPLDYIILFLFLLFLEDKPSGDKFILSNITTYIKNTAITLKLDHIPDWNNSQNRRSLVRVIDYLIKLKIIKLLDSDEKNFQENIEADALYQSEGLANYLLPSFDYEIFTCKTPEDFIKNQWGGRDEEKGDIRRYKIYRSLFYEPATFTKELNTREYEYLSKMHKTIKNEISMSTDYDVEITKNMALIYTEENKLQKNNFPNTKNISDIILIINKKLVEFQTNNHITLDQNECFTILKNDLDRILKDIKEENITYIAKKYKDLSFPKFKEEIIDYMQKFNFLKEEENNFLIYPMIYRYLGKTMRIKQTNIQETLFGGDDNAL